LNAIVGILNTIETNFSNNSFILGSRDADLAGQVFYFRHAKRWLAFRSTGKIFQADIPGNYTTLSDCGGFICSQDLHTIPWLTYGMLYGIEGCEYAFEMDSNA
jgi:hypothetical protein